VTLTESPQASGAEKPPGFIYTFYSYKGGVGRSMALANVAVCMALSGKRLLLVDWDLEAPGLEVFFTSSAFCELKGDPAKVPGLIDLLEPKEKERTLDWRNCLLRATFLGKQVDILSAGRRSDDYRQRVQQLDWSTLYGEGHRIGNFIDSLRNEWRKEYDFVLIDSRTGITDIGDICTVLLPDALVCVFVSNQQNIHGIQSVVARARKARNKLPVNRSHLAVVPLPSRDEIYNENAKATEWRARYADELGDLFTDWLPEEVTPQDAMNKLFIPYVTIWSFGERIPILESSRESQDPTTIGAAYQRVATLLQNRLSWYSLEERASSSELQGTRVELHKAREEARAKQEEIERLAARRRRVRNWSLGGSVALVGMLAAIAIPGYADYTVRSQLIEGLNVSSAVRAAVAEHYAGTGEMPNSNDAASLPQPTLLSGVYVTSVSVREYGEISIQYGNAANVSVASKHVLFKPFIDENLNVVWKCSSTEIEQKYLPQQCRAETTHPAPLADPQCAAKAEATTRGEEPFQVEGGARCESAGVSGKGVSRTQTIAYKAPPGYFIVGQAQVAVLSRIDGNHGPVVYEPAEGSAQVVSVLASCKSANKPFGPGASMQIRLTGKVARQVGDEDREKAFKACLR
jgi:MinD-like ATPase involved in chromosome partitioning or flagellar assembly